MIVVYAEKEDMGIRYAAALGGITLNNITVTTSNLSDYMEDIKKTVCRAGYISTSYNHNEIIVTWGWGHFGTLKDIKDYDPSLTKWKDIPLPFIPKKFEAKRIENKNEFFKKRDDRQFKIVTELFHRSDCEYIVNATDWEREGELIFAYVYDLTKTNKPYKRLRNTAKTEKEIKKAFSNLVSSEENYPYVLAARARSIADWTIGINMTIAATRFLSKDFKMINVGRVLTPTLSLIVEREKEILNFKEETLYGIQAEFTLPNGEKYIGKAKDNLFDTEEKAQNLIVSMSDKGTIKDIEIKNEIKHPPLLHNTQTLQIEANELYGYTLEETLNTAQKLYEAGYITYPRVDSQYLTEDKKGEMGSIISNLFNSNRYKEFATSTEMPSRYFNDKKVDGHDAIITTDVLPKSLSKQQMDIYDLIVRRMLMSVMPDMEIKKTTVTTMVDDIEFKSYGTEYTNIGFGKLYVNKEFENTELPKSIRETEIVSSKYETYEQTSKPPTRFTDASLIKAMENCGKKMEDDDVKNALKKSKGIGRPATRAAIMERLIKAEFVERRKKTIFPTEKGMETISVITIDDIKSPILTADWEMALDEIETSTPEEAPRKLSIFFKSIRETATEWCKEMEKARVKQIGDYASFGENCPCCGQPIIEGKDNYYCSAYKEGCKFSIKKIIANKRLTEAMVRKLINSKTTGPLKGFKRKDGKTFDASINLVPAFKCTICGALQPEENKKCYKDGGELVPDEKETLLTALVFNK